MSKTEQVSPRTIIMDPNGNPETTGKKTVGPATVSEYLDPQYWNDRFSKEEHYEWLKDYSYFRHLIQAHIKPASSVLELGCGNSQLSDELYKEGITTEITCVDLSSVAIEKTRERLQSKGYKDNLTGRLVWKHSFQELQTSEKTWEKNCLLLRLYFGFTSFCRKLGKPEIKVLEADMLDPPFSNESFDVILEKGTMDVLFVDSGDPWNPNPETKTRVMAMLDNVHRILKQDGIYISISFGQPHFRRPFFNSPQFTWSVEYTTFGDSFHYFFFILRKGRRSSNGEEPRQRREKPSINLLHEELDNEDYIFRTNIDDMDS